jgi:DNA-binding NtrC family response regulator
MKSILIVDDSDLFVKLVSVWLKDADYEYEIVDGGYDAVRALQNKHFDMMITDVYMPELSGPKLVDYVKNKYKKMIIVVMSVHPLEIIEKMVDIKNKYIKPTNKKEFIKIIEDCFNSK